MAESPLIRGLQSAPEVAKFQQAVQAILKELGVTAEQVRDDLLGDALVVAYRKGPPGREADEDGLVLLHARDPDLLRRVIDRVVAVQTRAGEIKGVEPVGDGEGQYFRRVKTVENEPPDFYAVRGNRLVFTGRETLLRSVLPGLTAPASGEPAIARRMKHLGVNESPVSVLINPRSFDADVAAGAGKPSEVAFVREFARYWKAVDGLALFLNLRPSIEVGVAVHARTGDLPGPAGRFLAEAGKRSPLWDRIPDDALFAVAGRVHLDSLAATLGPFLTAADRAKVLEGIADAARPFLETEDFAALARGLGPDVGFWLTAPPAGSGSWVPAAVLAARVGEGPDGKLSEDAALRGLDFAARLAALQHKGLRVHTERREGVEVGSVSHPAFPPGFRPAFGSRGGYVVVAESPETVRRFDPPTGAAAPAAEVPVLRLSVTAWRKYLAEHRGPLVKYVAGVRGENPADLNRHLDTLLPLLDGLDRVEVVQRSGPDRLAVVVRVREVKR